jgi:hypothetical protein
MLYMLSSKWDLAMMCMAPAWKWVWMGMLSKLTSQLSALYCAKISTKVPETWWGNRSGGVGMKYGFIEKSKIS